MSILDTVIGKMDPYGQIERLAQDRRMQRERSKARLMDTINNVVEDINQRARDKRQFERDKEKMQLQSDLNVSQAEQIGDLSTEDRVELEQEMREMGMPGGYTDPTTGKSYQWSTPEEFQMALQRANTDRAYWLNRASATEEQEQFDPFERMASYIYQGFTEDAAYKNLYGGIADISGGLDREFAAQNPDLYNRFKDSVLQSINTDPNLSDWERGQIRNRALSYFSELESPDEDQEAQDRFSTDWQKSVEAIRNYPSAAEAGLSYDQINELMGDEEQRALDYTRREEGVSEDVQEIISAGVNPGREYQTSVGPYSLNDIIDLIRQPNERGPFGWRDQGAEAKKILEEIIKQTTGSGASGSF